MITLYGIPNCDTVKKARAWFTAQGVEYRFHDFKKLGVPAERLDVWLQTLGWETVLNRKGTAWRGLDDATKAGVQDATSARAVALVHVSVIKRPVVEWADGPSVGFTEAAFTQRLRNPGPLVQSHLDGRA